MDIQISSNFERLLFEENGRDAAGVRIEMQSLKQSGAFMLDDMQIDRIRDSFDAGRSTEKETAATIRSVMEKNGYLLDPHSATALHVARQRPRSDVPMVVLATAHPAKFPAAVEAASGIAPALPARLAELMQREERYTTLPSDIKMVEDHIFRHSRAAGRQE